MNKFLIYLLGVVTGVALTFGFAYLKSESDGIVNDNGITLFDQVGEKFNASAFKVIQVIDDNHALAQEMRWESFLEEYMPDDLVVLITNDSGEYYYDDQMIKSTKTKCFKQVGIYKYETRAGIEKTVPILKLLDI